MFLKRRTKSAVFTDEKSLKIDSYGNTYIKMPFTERLVVPISCVTHIGYKDVALIYDKSKNAFKAKSILIGARDGNYYPAIEGLKSKEIVLKLKNLRKIININDLRKINHYLILSSVKINSL